MTPHVNKRIEAQFKLLNKTSSVAPIQVAALSKILGDLLPADEGEIDVKSEVAKLFATSSVDAWQRAVHSFLVSCSLTHSSPLWSAVTGYYASHYAVRAFAHLFGCYLLFSKKRLVELNLVSGRYVCSFNRKGASDREHKVYWKRVGQNTPISNDPFFKLDIAALPDVKHRDRANYADHLMPYYKPFKILDKEMTLQRIDQISKIEFNEPPIPKLSAFVDLSNVQVIAYHRIVRYRSFLDELLGTSSRYWAVYRTPTFSTGFIDFQVTSSRTLAEAP